MQITIVSEPSPEHESLLTAMNHNRLAMRMVAKLGIPAGQAGEVWPGAILPGMASPASGDGKPKVFPMLWGFSNPQEGGSSFPSLPLESAGRYFREDWERHHCVIPCSYVYAYLGSPTLTAGRHHGPGSKDGHGNLILYQAEPTPDQEQAFLKEGDRYLLQAKNHTITYLAGLYHMEREPFPEQQGSGGGIETGSGVFPHFALLTREARNLPLRRLPVMLPQEAIEAWIQPGGIPEEVLRDALTDPYIEKA